MVAFVKTHASKAPPMLLDIEYSQTRLPANGINLFTNTQAMERAAGNLL